MRSVPLIGTLFKLKVKLDPFFVPVGCSPKTMACCHAASVEDFATRTDPLIGALDALMCITDVAVLMVPTPCFASSAPLTTTSPPKTEDPAIEEF